MLLPKQAVTFAQLRAEGLSAKEITALSAGLRLFPTPFKGIYYVPLEEERRGTLLEKPMNVLIQALSLFFGNKNFYFSCDTAKEALGITWQRSGSIHLVNPVLSRRINIRARILRNEKRGTWRSRKIARILSYYGDEIVLHRGSISTAKTKETPYGCFALRSQIKADALRFRERPAA